MRLKITVPAEGRPRISGSVDENVLRMGRDAEKLAAEALPCRVKLKVSSKETDKVMAEAAT